MLLEDFPGLLREKKSTCSVSKIPLYYDNTNTCYGNFIKGSGCQTNDSVIEYFGTGIKRKGSQGQETLKIHCAKLYC